MTDQGLLVSAVTGYRTFVVKEGGRLYSQFSDVEWPSFPNVTFEAKCEVGRYFGLAPTFCYVKDPDTSEVLEYEPCLVEHEAPHRDCGCGIHAFYDVGSVSPSTLPWSSGEAVTGLIVGWGEVIPHPDGFRCSKARICALAGRTSRARLAAENCGVELVDRRADLVGLAPEFGHTMPAQLIPHPKERTDRRQADHVFLNFFRGL